LGLDLNLDVVNQHPCDPGAFFDTTQEGWEKRLGVSRRTTKRFVQEAFRIGVPMREALSISYRTKLSA